MTVNKRFSCFFEPVSPPTSEWPLQYSFSWSVGTPLDKKRNKSYTHIKSSTKSTNNHPKSTTKFSISKSVTSSASPRSLFVSLRQCFSDLLASMASSEFATTTNEFASMKFLVSRLKRSQNACVRFFTSLQSTSKNEFITYSDTGAMTWKIEKNESINLLSSLNKLVFFAILCHCQCANTLDLSVLQSAVNQDAPINKNSKSSNSRSLKQHTLAESISLCCFCSAREIGRFIILICKYLSHRSKSRFSTKFSFSSHISIFLRLRIFCFSHLSLHVYRICFGISSANHDQANIWVIVDDSLRNADRSGKKNSRFGTKLEREKRIMLRACLRISIEILSYQRKFIWELARSETWRSQYF